MNKLVSAILSGLFTIMLIMIISFNSWSQEGNVVYSVKKTRVVDQSNYEEIRGTPYLYNEWYTARLLDADGKFHDFSRVNFNGYTRELETEEDGQVEEFVAHSYLKIIVNTGTNSDTFIRGIHPDFGRSIVCIIFDGQEVKFIKKFEVKLEESVVQTPGVPTVFEKFSSTLNYYIMVEGELSRVKLKKKKIIEVLGHKADIENYLKKEKINLNSESALILLLNYYESII